MNDDTHDLKKDSRLCLQNVDVLFNCAGFVHQGSILDCPESEWDKSFELNVKAVYKMCQAFIPNVSETVLTVIIARCEFHSQIADAGTRQELFHRQHVVGVFVDQGAPKPLCIWR